MLIEHIDELRKISDEELERRYEALNHYVYKFKEIFGSEVIPSEWNTWLGQMETELFERACRGK